MVEMVEIAETSDKRALLNETKRTLCIDELVHSASLMFEDFLERVQFEGQEIVELMDVYHGEEVRVLHGLGCESLAFEQQRRVFDAW